MPGATKPEVAPAPDRARSRSAALSILLSRRSSRYAARGSAFAIGQRPGVLGVGVGVATAGAAVPEGVSVVKMSVVGIDRSVIIVGTGTAPGTAGNSADAVPGTEAAVTGAPIMAGTEADNGRLGSSASWSWA